MFYKGSVRSTRFEFWAVALAVEAAAALLSKRGRFSFIDLLIDLLCPYKEVTADNLMLYFLWFSSINLLPKRTKNNKKSPSLFEFTEVFGP